MSDSPQLGITYLESQQASAEVTFNEAINKLEAVTQLSIKDRDLTAPPGSPANGDRYLVKATATGAWAGQEGKIAIYYTGWIFLTPKEGWRMWVDDENVTVVYDGSAWVRTPQGAAVANLSQSITNPPTQTEVQNIQTKLNDLLTSLRNAGIIVT